MLARSLKCLVPSMTAYPLRVLLWLQARTKPAHGAGCISYSDHEPTCELGTRCRPRILQLSNYACGRVPRWTDLFITQRSFEMNVESYRRRSTHGGQTPARQASLIRDNQRHRTVSRGAAIRPTMKLLPATINMITSSRPRHENLIQIVARVSS